MELRASLHGDSPTQVHEQEPAMSGTEPNDRSGDRVGSDREMAALEREIDLSLRRADDASTGRAVIRRRSPWLIAFTVLLGVALIATGALSVYLWQTTDEWRAEAANRAELATGVAEQRDELAGELDQTQRDLEATEAQLLELQDRLLELADERAQTGDELAMTQLIAQDVARAAAELRSCVENQRVLIEVLEEIELYDPDSVAQGAQQVDELCNQALASIEDLERRLERG
jgi:septal ring factor EnvC (AmiA/AmiB activator)